MYLKYKKKSYWYLVENYLETASGELRDKYWVRKVLGSFP